MRFLRNELKLQLVHYLICLICAHIICGGHTPIESYVVETEYADTVNQNFVM